MTEHPASVDDAPAIAALIRSLAGPFLTSPDGTGADAFFESVSAAAIARYIASPNFDYRVRVEDGGDEAVDGGVADRLVAIGAMRDGRHLYHLFVAPSHQGRGLARGLWTQLRDAAAARGHAGAFTVNASLNAQAVYARFGFVPSGEVQRVHGIAFRPMILEPAAAPAPSDEHAPVSPRSVHR